jgi:tRNA nucleotidyltransferase (CCA-adding enzyme)
MTADLQIYLVGGAVRDDLLGLSVTERDWVVVGATPAQMRTLGYLPIDADFPVFRHPESGDEYALARREIKHGEGYRGFDVYAGPDVTLEQDLARRDLTINAIARDRDGGFIDPFGGRSDLDAGLLKHVSPAFVEDPVRVLRAARFAAKLGRYGFRVAHSSHRLMRAMVERGDMQYLKPERVWRETNKAMQTEQPWRYFEVLHRCGALHTLMPPLAAAMGEPQGHAGQSDSPPMAALKRISTQHQQPSVRISAVLMSCVSLADDADALVGRLRADRPTAELLRRVLVVGELAEPARAGEPSALAEMIRRWRALASPDIALAAAAVIDAQHEEAVLQPLLSRALPAVARVSAETLRESGVEGRELGRLLERERVRAIAAALE